MSNVAALGLNLSFRYISCISWSHKAIISGPHVQFTCSIFLWPCGSLTSGTMSPDEAVYWSFPLVCEHLTGSQNLIPIVCSPCLACSLLGHCHCSFLLQRDTGICFELFYAFSSRPCCQLSLLVPIYLGSDQTTSSLINVCCYCHCSDYSSGRELQ